MPKTPKKSIPEKSDKIYGNPRQEAIENMLNDFRVKGGELAERREGELTSVGIDLGDPAGDKAIFQLICCGCGQTVGPPITKNNWRGVVNAWLENNDLINPSY